LETGRLVPKRSNDELALDWPPPPDLVDTRTELSEAGIVKGAEFERRVRKLTRSRKLTCQFVADKGKGSHGRLYFGDEFTTLKDRKKEIGRDLLAKMCADLKIDPHDL
jgi:mRNA interferase HicA